MQPENPLGMARLQAFVSGAVQGVGYRYFAMNAAHELGVIGWVRNLYDGTVQVVAEGPRETLEEFLKHLHRGPHSGVQTGDIVDKRSETSLTLYRIRHEGEHLPCHGKRVQQWKNESGSSRKQK